MKGNNIYNTMSFLSSKGHTMTCRRSLVQISLLALSLVSVAQGLSEGDPNVCDKTVS